MELVKSVICEDAILVAGYLLETFGRGEILVSGLELGTKLLDGSKH